MEKEKWVRHDWDKVDKRYKEKALKEGNLYPDDIDLGKRCSDTVSLVVEESEHYYILGSSNEYSDNKAVLKSDYTEVEVKDV